ncbi:uncharacterized protein PV09_03856 [Verruconis gallopava]|uniref:F-box domain-containing protein n=1 Tax=Verruconis gallopava TaxID=253628 RepID=A0A0D1YXA3_9PEZI|nr:uncharacterized protein PV09_03856 [Verruconis gallopava]KIW05337.1 hypothetical protein PV09_03856 [Verruconis gallopava]
MPKNGRKGADEIEPLVDLTQDLQLNSKKLERLRKRQQKRAERGCRYASHSILDLPYELLLKVLELLRPSDVLRLSRTCKAFHDFLRCEEETIARKIINHRYVAISKCFLLPVLLRELDARTQNILRDEERQEIVNLKKRPFQHIKSPDPSFLCTCMTCLLRWNSLNLIVDWNYWQDNLDKGEPIPMIARGKCPEWNALLIEDNASYVLKALERPLWHALLFERHLDSMVRSISRQKANRGNKRKRFEMTAEDEASGTDVFLEREGPPTLELPFHRDQYYLLETYMPNRGWNSDQRRWMYVPAEQHETDVTIAVRFFQWREQQKSRNRGS